MFFDRLGGSCENVGIKLLKGTTMDTQEQIIASALKLPFEQRAAIVNALVGTVQDTDDHQALDRFLNDRISSAGDLSDKSFADIKREARL